MASTIFSPDIPCIQFLPSPLNPGCLIRISGTVASSATCFAINLQNGSSTNPRSDIALHLSPVFSPPPRLVRNSLENQNWGPEEGHGPDFPFRWDEQFEILILAESNHFKIAINGQHFTEFQYRLPLSSISHIAIDGDVAIREIKFESLAKSPTELESGDEKPLGFVIEPETKASLAPSPLSGRPPSSLPYPTNPSFVPSPMFPSPTASPYGPPQGGSYGPPQGGSYGPPQGGSYGPPQGGSYGPNPYGPPPESNMYPAGRVSPSPYGPAPGPTSPYGPPPGAYPYVPQQGYPQQTGNYPASYPNQQAAYYPGYPYPSQPGPHPGTSVVYPGEEKQKSSFDLGPLAAAGAAALAGVAGSHVMGKKHKKHKHGHYGIPGMAGAGPASLISGVGSLLTGTGSKHGSHGGGSSVPIGGALAGGAAALAGAYMLNKSPMGKMMKPKKMKKMYKGWGSSSSSSSSDEE